MAADSSIEQTETLEDLSLKVHAIMDRVKTTKSDPRLKKVKGSYLFDVTDVGKWRVEVDKGETKVVENAFSGDCIIHLEASDFVRIANGEQNLLTAMMQGRLELEGDMVLAQRLHGLIGVPPEEKKIQGKGGAA